MTSGAAADPSTEELESGDMRGQKPIAKLAIFLHRLTLLPPTKRISWTRAYYYYSATVEAFTFSASHIIVGMAIGSDRWRRVCPHAPGRYDWLKVLEDKAVVIPG